MTYALFCFSTSDNRHSLCGLCLHLRYQAADDKKWAAGIVCAIASGTVGFLVGQGKNLTGYKSEQRINNPLF